MAQTDQPAPAESLHNSPRQSRLHHPAHAPEQTKPHAPRPALVRGQELHGKGEKDGASAQPVVDTAVL